MARGNECPRCERKVFWPIKELVTFMNHRYEVLIITLLVLSFSCRVPNVLALDELVVNGGFESGEFGGWNADATCQIIPMYRLKPHEGWYSVRIGAESRPGTLSQTFVIPDKSTANLSFAYRLDEGATLDVRLYLMNGTTIRHWNLTEKTDWRLLKHSIGSEYAGKSVVLTFKGRVFTEERWIPVDSEPTSRPEMIGYILVRINYWAFVDSVSVAYKISLYDVDVETSGLPGNLSSKITIDGRAEGSVRAGMSRRFRFPLGERHEVKLEEQVYETAGVRYVCKDCAAHTNASGDNVLLFAYSPQFLLSVESSYGRTAGSGWYSEGASARISVEPETIPVEGFWGCFGAKHVFREWREDTLTIQSTDEVIVNSAKTLSAVWEEDYSLSYASFGGLTAAAAIMLLVVMIFRKRRLHGR